MFPATAWACDRSIPPLAGSLAAADAVVVARGTGDADGTDVLTVARVLRGEVPAGPLPVTVPLECGRPTSLPPTDGLLALRRRGDAWEVLLDPRKYPGDPRYDEAVELALALRSVGWSAPLDGWSTVAAREPTGAGAPPGVDLVVGVRNGADHPRTLSWTDWPRATASHLEVEVHGPGGPVTPVSAGSSDAERERYFSAHGRRFEVTLAPGEFHLFRFDRLDSAPAGWGYKEDLGFRSWPMPAPGEYHVRATLVGVGPTLPPVELVVRR